MASAAPPHCRGSPPPPAASPAAPWTSRSCSNSMVAWKCWPTRCMHPLILVLVVSKWPLRVTRVAAIVLGSSCCMLLVSNMSCIQMLTCKAEKQRERKLISALLPQPGASIGRGSIGKTSLAAAAAAAGSRRTSGAAGAVGRSSANVLELAVAAVGGSRSAEAAPKSAAEHFGEEAHTLSLAELQEQQQREVRHAEHVWVIFCSSICNR